MRTSEIFADAIQLLRKSGRDHSLIADYGMCGHLLHHGEVRYVLLAKYRPSDLLTASDEAQAFVGPPADGHMGGFLIDILAERYGIEEAVERWFQIYEDWENRYDYIDTTLSFRRVDRPVTEVLKLLSGPAYDPEVGMCLTLKRALDRNQISPGEYLECSSEVRRFMWGLEDSSIDSYLISYVGPNICKQIYQNWENRYDYI